MFTLANLHELEYFAHIPAYLIKFCICHATQIMIEQLCQMTNNCGLLQNWHGFCAEWFKNFIKHSARLYVACFFLFYAILKILSRNFLTVSPILRKTITGKLSWLFHKVWSAYTFRYTLLLTVCHDIIYIHGNERVKALIYGRISYFN